MKEVFPKDKATSPKGDIITSILKPTEQKKNLETADTISMLRVL